MMAVETKARRVASPAPLESATTETKQTTRAQPGWTQRSTSQRPTPSAASRKTTTMPAIAQPASKPSAAPQEGAVPIQARSCQSGPIV